ncbi:MAG TPA: transglycosylase domain-containing protein [Kofleriaceae bacterium]|jgi:hypothetical protein|nr:transglycosylase domain-containing protein [Kofleriaceae bacterium]
MIARRDRRILVATCVCAVGVPAAAAGWLGARTEALAGELGAAAGVPARIGAVDAELTGTVRLSDIELGEPGEPGELGSLVRADSIEVSVGLDSLLAGALRADEIRVAGPRVQLEVGADGDSDLARLARRLLARIGSPVRPADSAGPARPAADPGARRLRRIVVSAGTLSAHVAGVGELSAEGVELVPDGSGVRVITGPVRISGHAGPLDAELAFTRSAAELTLPHLRFGRLLAVGGSGTIGSARLRGVSVGRLAPGTPGGAIELRAAVDDGGIARPLEIDVQPRAQAIAIRGDRIPLGALAALAPHGVELAAARATGSLAVHRDAARTVIEIDGAIEGAAIDQPVLAPVAVPLAAKISAQLAISPEAITVPRAAIELGAAHWTANGWWRRGQPASGQLELSLAPTGCSDLLAALPAELRGPLDGMVLDGVLGGHVRLAVDLAAPDGDGTALDASISDGCRSEADPPAADVARLARPGDQVFADGSHARIGPGEPGWLAIDRGSGQGSGKASGQGSGQAGQASGQVPRYVAGAFVSAEDARFYDHAGFDLTQIAKSLEIDLREHRLARGGSTISQQLVKNAFLSARRSFDRKLQEAILTWRLEARLDKAQILERYLNVIELGPHVFGVTAAAHHWFDAAPRELTVRQAAFLAALTSEPTTMSRRVRRAGGLDADSAARLDVVLRAMRRDGRIDAAQFDAARAAPLHFAPAALTQER